MNTQAIRFICAILLLMAAPTVHSNSNAEPMRSGSVTFADGYDIKVEIADTETLRETGLMHRTHLEEGRGMLFVYPDQAIRGVWMKNTLIPLDVLFLSGDGKIITMLRTLPPCTQEPCPISISSDEAQYMLEVNAGFIDKHQVQTGQVLILDYNHNPGE